MRKLVMLTCLFLVPVCAISNSIVPISGSGFWNGAITSGIAGAVGPYTFSSSLPDGSIPFGLCAIAAPCIINASAPAFPQIDDSEVDQGGRNVGVLFGSLNLVSFPFRSPSGNPHDPISVVTPIPVVVSGFLSVGPWTPGYGAGPAIASYTISGIGTINGMSGYVAFPDDWFTNGSFTFAGIAIDSRATPEPGSLTLMGLGLAALGFRLVRQLRRCACR